MPAALIQHLEAMFANVRHAVTTGTPEDWQNLGQNAKGDDVKWFDVAADHTVCTYLEQHFPAPISLWSEEGPPRQFGTGDPAWTLILDPVDGSKNFARGIPSAGSAMALVPAKLPVSTHTVQYALVGDLYTGSIWTAERGAGAYLNHQPLYPKVDKTLGEAIFSFDSNRFVPDAALLQVLAQSQGARSFGAAAIGLVMVADGKVDAHLDLRDDLTPENFLAPALIITEAGGIITDRAGHPLPNIQTLTERYSVLAAATATIHTNLVAQLSL